MTPPPGRGDGPLDFDGTYARFGAAIYARCRQMLRDPAAAESNAGTISVIYEPNLRE